jgi:hypothetical protein
MAVIVLPPITVLVGTTVTLVIAGVETGRAALAETMLPSVFRAPRVIVVEGPTPRAKQRTLLQDAVVVVITAPPGRVVGTLGAVIAGVERLAPVPTLMMLPSEFRAPSVTVVEGPTPRARQRTPLHDVAVLVTPGMLGTPVTTGVDPRPAPISMMLPSGLRAPRVAVTEGPTPRAKHTAPLHWVEVAVYCPLAPEKVVGVDPNLPPRPRLTVTPFPIPRVAHKSTSAPPQLVVVEVKVTPVGKVTPGGRTIPLVMGPTTLVMDAIALDPSDRIEEIEAVASLWTEEMMLEMLVGLVTPLVRELMMLETSDSMDETTPVADAPISLVRELTALVTPEMIGTEENPGREGLKLVEPALIREDARLVASLKMEETSEGSLEVPTGPTTEEIKPEGREVAVGSSEISELNAPVLTALAVVSCEIKEESWLPMTPVAVDASEARLDRTPLGTAENPGREGLKLVEPALTPVGTLAETLPDAPAVAPTEAGGRIEEAADERRANIIPLRVTPLVREL